MKETHEATAPWSSRNVPDRPGFRDLRDDLLHPSYRCSDKDLENLPPDGSGLLPRLRGADRAHLLGLSPPARRAARHRYSASLFKTKPAEKKNTM